MNNDKPTLRDIALRASDRNGGARGRALRRIAEKQGLTLSHTTVDRIIAGTYTSTPTAKTLEALAYLANVKIEDVRRAAELPVPLSSFAEQLPPDVDLLDGAQREAVIAVVRQFVAAQKALHLTEEVRRDAGSAAPTTAADGDRVNNPGLAVVPPSGYDPDESEDAYSEEDDAPGAPPEYLELDERAALERDQKQGDDER